jgi:hypothetical protein
MVVDRSMGYRTFEFRACVEDAVEPIQADQLASGTAPFRAAVHCQPFREASGLGWHAFPALDCYIKWDGDEFFWLPVGRSKWQPLRNVTTRALRALEGRNTDDDALAASMPLLLAAPEPGILQIWTGLIGISDPQWCLLVRGRPNLASSSAVQALEGIIETGWWHGPIIGNLRFKKTDHPVRISRQQPLFALQPVVRESYSATLSHHDYRRANEDSSTTKMLLAEALSIREAGKPGGYRREFLRRGRITHVHDGSSANTERCVRDDQHPTDH